MFLEPDPVVLVTTANENHSNIMTLSWTMVLDFTPRFAFMTGPWNYSYTALSKTRECVIAVPTVELAEITVQIGACSEADADKFEQF
jgi:flavin reductase (DIM6/NTAB) family NADH-FMN oxidoreductase RutF